ncbi:MAG: prepilin-type cleavage/methylation domain-containing protein [Hydrogenobaculum sp.]|nr:MAG: prepilin-type cleavage/methylation domain-containing protein [Hydrogenobaculum sp.]
MKGFSIIEFLLVLTAFVIFLGAAFIGYRTLKANADQEHISQRVNLFIKGITQYAQDFGAYPYITCANANDWNTAASSNRVASCSALMSYIGHWLASADSGQTWQYYGWNDNYQPGCEGTGTSCNESATQGFYAIATPYIPTEYAQGIANRLNELGMLSCNVYTGSGSWYNTPSGYSFIECTSYYSKRVFLSPTSPSF